MIAHRLVPYRGLLVAIGLAAALQTAIVLRSPSVTADGIIFAGISKDLARGPIEAFHMHDQHPGYPAMLLAGARLLQHLGYNQEPECWMLGGQMTTFVCGILSVWVVWLLARDLFDVRVANLAAFIFAILPVPRANAADAMSDTPHVLFYLLAAWLVSSAIAKNDVLRLAGAGLASGVAYWIRPEGLEVAVVGLACVAWRGVSARWGLRRTALAVGTLAATALMVAAPYMILAGKLTSKQLTFAKVRPTMPFIAQLAEVHAQPVADLPAESPSDPVTPPNAATVVDAQSQPQGLVAPAASEIAPTPPTDRSPEIAPTPPAAVTRHYSPRLVIRVVSKAVAVFIASICQGFKWVFLPLYLLGNVELLRRKPDWGPVVFIALLGVAHVAVLLGVFIISGYIAHRHVLPLVALAMPFTALGVIYVGERLAALRRLPAVYGVAATLIVCTVSVLPYTLHPFCREFVPVIQAVKWVDAHAEPGAGVISNSPYVGFYGTLPMAYLGPESPTLDEAVAQAPASARYDFVVLHVGAHAYQPSWLAMIERNYRPVQQFPDPLAPANRPKKVLVFEAKDRNAQFAAPATRS